MDSRSRLELSPGLWLDARRAVFLAETRTLAVADLHLGYAWAHRAHGNLLPIQAADDSVARLRTLIEDYAPREVALLGDIVHAALDLAPLRAELQALAALESLAPLRLVAGNHDLNLPALLKRAGISLEVCRESKAGPHLLLHGDEIDASHALARLAAARETGGRVIFGHEHPAFDLFDGVATRTRCACFLVADDALVLPAFSSWAAGVEVRSGTFLSPYSRAAKFRNAVPIVAGKLIRMDLVAPR